MQLFFQCKDTILCYMLQIISDLPLSISGPQMGSGQGLFVGEAGAPGEVVEAAAGVVGAAEDALHHDVVLAGVYAHGAYALCGKVRFGHGKDLGGQTLTAKVRGYGQSMDDAVEPGVVPYPG